jgi:hypothetical protein
MSDIRVALVAEGPTDSIVIEAALSAILNKHYFTLTLLQPEPTLPQIGTGWCGVFKWCRDFVSRGATSLETDPTLPGFDLFIFHLDADVADKNYSDGGTPIEAASKGLATLPCSKPCPPPSDAANEIRQRLLSWLNICTIGPKTVFCVPSKAIEAWLAVGILPAGHNLIANIECDLNLEAKLAALSKNTRVKKSRKEYLCRKGALEKNWQTVRDVCTQAERFSKEITTACP